MELEMGLEPTTYWLRINCATNCATPANYLVLQAEQSAIDNRHYKLKTQKKNNITINKNAQISIKHLLEYIDLFTNPLISRGSYSLLTLKFFLTNNLQLTIVMICGMKYNKLTSRITQKAPIISLAFNPPSIEKNISTAKMKY